MRAALLLGAVGCLTWGCGQARPVQSSPTSSGTRSARTAAPAGGSTVSAGSTQEPSPQHRVGLEWGKKVRLLGYDVEPHEGAKTVLTMYYKCLAPISADYAMWTHLVPSNKGALMDPRSKQCGLVSWDEHFAPSTRTWQPGMYYTTVQAYPLPKGGGRWWIEVNLVESSGGTSRPLPIQNAGSLKAHFGCYVLPGPIETS